MIMPLRRGLPNRFVVTGKLNRTSEPGYAIATQTTEITRLRKGVEGRSSQLSSADVLSRALYNETTSISRIRQRHDESSVNSFTAVGEYL